MAIFSFCKTSIFIVNFIIIPLSIIICNAFTISFASVIYPQKYGTEGRFKSWLYHPNGIYHFTGHYMNPTYIEFAPKEKINTIYSPKPDAWQIVPVNNRLFLKPIDEDADTTLTVMTNLRTYFFELHAQTPSGPFDPDITFYVKFRYPSGTDSKTRDRSENNDGSIIEYVANKAPDLSKAENYNFYYEVSGDYTIKPVKVFDDGKFTYFEFKDVVPAIFSVDKSGYESMVNFRIVNQYLAVEGINAVYTLRYGADTVCVFNQTLRDLTRNLTKKK